MNKMQELNRMLVATQMAMHAREWVSAREWAEQAVALATELGGKAYLNPFWHDVKLSDECTMPGRYVFGISFGVTVTEWPTAEAGAVVEIDGSQYRVCLNLCSDPKHKSILEPLFGIYITLPV